MDETDPDDANTLRAYQFLRARLIVQAFFGWKEVVLRARERWGTLALSDGLFRRNCLKRGVRTWRQTTAVRVQARTIREAAVGKVVDEYYCRTLARRVLIHGLLLWVLYRRRVKDRVRRALAHRQVSLKRNSFRQWMRWSAVTVARKQAEHSLETLAATHRRRVVLRSCFRYRWAPWTRYCIVLREASLRLSELRRQRRLTTVYGFWVAWAHGRARLRQISTQLCHRHERLLLRSVFVHGLRCYTMNRRWLRGCEVKLARSHRIRFARRMFRLWQRYSRQHLHKRQLVSLALSHWRSNSLHHCFQLLKLHAFHSKELHSQRTLLTCFRHWQAWLIAHRRSVLNNTKAFLHWKSCACRGVLRALLRAAWRRYTRRLAIAFHSRVLLQGYFALWLQFAQSSKRFHQRTRVLLCTFHQWARLPSINATRAQMRRVAVRHARTTLCRTVFVAWRKRVLAVNRKKAMMLAACVWRRHRLQSLFIADLCAVPVLLQRQAAKQQQQQQQQQCLDEYDDEEEITIVPVSPLDAVTRYAQEGGFVVVPVDAEGEAKHDVADDNVVSVEGHSEHDRDEAAVPDVISVQPQPQQQSQDAPPHVDELDMSVSVGDESVHVEPTVDPLVITSCASVDITADIDVNVDQQHTQGDGSSVLDDGDVAAGIEQLMRKLQREKVRARRDKAQLASMLGLQQALFDVLTRLTWQQQQQQQYAYAEEDVAFPVVELTDDGVVDMEALESVKQVSVALEAIASRVAQLQNRLSVWAKRKRQSKRILRDLSMLLLESQQQQSL